VTNAHLYQGHAIDNVTSPTVVIGDRVAGRLASYGYGSTTTGDKFTIGIDGVGTGGLDGVTVSPDLAGNWPWQVDRNGYRVGRIDYVPYEPIPKPFDMSELQKILETIQGNTPVEASPTVSPRKSKPLTERRPVRRVRVRKS
jgi:hypothetical protein